jgi:hypothetical protein
MKNYYCIAVNLLPIMELEKTMNKIREAEKNIEEKEKPKMVKDIFTELTNKLKIEIIPEILEIVR